MLHKMTGNRPLIMAPIMAIIISLFYAFCLYPMANSTPKDIPVALVSMDRGVVTPNGPVNAGEEMVDKFSSSSKANSALKLSILEDEKKALEELADGKYCALLVIPEDFTEKQMSIATPNPSAPQLMIHINQGSYGMTATLTEQALLKIMDNGGTLMKSKVLGAIHSTGGNISDAQADFYDNPLRAEVSYVHPTGGQGVGMMAGNANALGGMITWIVSLVSSILLYLYYKKEKVHDISFSTKRITTQVLVGLLVACLAGLSIAFSFTSILNVDIPFWATFAFETTAVFALIMIILGVLRWLGFGGIVLFAITLFLGISTVTIPYELLPQFWQNWVYPWVPVRLVSGGLREIFYVSGDWFNESSAVFLWVTIIGIALSYLSLLNKKKIN